MKEEKRYKVAYVSQGFLADLFTIGNKIHLKVLKGVPKTASVRNIFYNPDKACFAVIYYDKSFKKLQEAELIPEVKLEFRLL